MRLYHVTEGTRQEMLSFEGCGKLNYLVSAWAYYRDKRLPKNIQKIRDNAQSLIIDSGFLGAAKKGMLDWHEKQDYVIEVALEAKADIVVALDIPMEPHVLKMVNLTRKEALEITIANAESFSKVDLPPEMIKMFVVQGWYLEDYEWCLAELYKKGCLTGHSWLGIGSVCMRHPGKRGRENNPKYQLYDVCRLIAQKVPNMHLHCFGIANPQWMWNLEKIGIDSCDSATAVMAASFREKVNKFGQRQYVYFDSTVETRAVLLRDNKLMLTNLSKQCDWQLPLF